MRKLDQEQLRTALAGLPQWQLDNGELVREWTFSRFMDAIGFVQRVAALAEELGHHPDIDIRYTRVRLGLVTHDADGISSRDTQFASALGE